MKVKVIRSFIDKNTMKDIDKDTELEITEERFSELTAGPRGIFVEKIEDAPPADPPVGQNANEEPKVYECKKCDFKTTNKGELAAHYKAMHPKTQK